MKHIILFLAVSFFCPREFAFGETKPSIEVLLEKSGVDTLKGDVRDFYGPELELKKDQYPSKLWPIIKTAGEHTQNSPDIHDLIKAALVKVMGLKDLSEVDAFLSDPKVMAILKSFKSNQETYLNRPDAERGSFLKHFLQGAGVDSPRRAHLYFLDAEVFHQIDLMALLHKISFVQKTEIANLSLPKSQKRDHELLSEEMKKTISQDTELLLDELTYFFKDVSTEDLAYFLHKIRTPGVAKLYDTTYLTARDSLLGLIKKFVGKVRELHREKNLKAI